MPRLKVFIRSPQQRHKLLRFTPVGRKKPITRHAAVIIEAKYLELLRRGYEVTVGRTGDKEIDFVCDKRGEKLYVQVCYLLASDETVNREFGAYDAIRDNFPKYVVSLDEFDMSRNGIKHRISAISSWRRNGTKFKAQHHVKWRDAGLLFCHASGLF